LGVSATKEEVHRAVAQTDAGLFPGAFCRIAPDVLADNPDWCCAVHADDAGTKALVAYLIYRETGAAGIFRSLAQDALVMNLDDLACIGAVERFLLSNTISRNRYYVGGDAIAEVIAGYADCVDRLATLGIRITATGGETADMVDAVRTIVVGATLTTRLRRDAVIDNRRIEPGDLIVGLSATGRATYEDRPNSGIGDNGLTLARHALLHRRYREKYPETVAPEIDPALAYRGPFSLDDEPGDLGMSVGEALSSPTRTYAPVVRAVLATIGRDVHGMVHCTGGGQAKCKNFGENIGYYKDRFFDCPPLFRLIAECGEVSWREMYQTFNMGHRFELMVAPAAATNVIAISRQFGIDAQVIGRCESSVGNRVVLETPYGGFQY
jgi:phosphoribosylformylglycinamidine cyclo-ligase